MDKKRINMKVPSDLVRWAKRYAKRNDTNLTKLFVDFLQNKKENDTTGLSLSDDFAKELEQ